MKIILLLEECTAERLVFALEEGEHSARVIIDNELLCRFCADSYTHKRQSAPLADFIKGELEPFLEAMR